MAHHNFEELEIWKRSSRLAVNVLHLADSIKLWSLKDQISRSSISVPSNIAEGAEREGDREFRRFLNIAKGSCGELRTQLYIAVKAEIITTEQATPLINETKEIGAMIQAFSKRLQPPWFTSVFGWLF